MLANWISDIIAKKKLPNYELILKTYPKPSVKYLGVKIDENLNCDYHINDLAAKLNGANALVFKIRGYVNRKVLRSISYVTFDSHLNCVNLQWAQNSNAIQQIIIL